jgi:hypothetical protein
LSQILAMTTLVSQSLCDIPCVISLV